MGVIEIASDENASIAVDLVMGKYQKALEAFLEF